MIRSQFFVLLLPVLVTAGSCTGFLVKQSRGEVVVETSPQPLSIATPHYHAEVGVDGCLTNLRIGGTEFLAPGVSISRGSYFFHEGVLKLGEVGRPAANVVAAKSEQASIRYEFDEASMTWKLANLTDEPLVFFLVFSDSLDAVTENGADLMSPAIERSLSRATFCTDDATLSIEGLDRIWGPWQGPHQVAEVSLKSHEERTLLLTVGTVSEAQRIKLSALALPPPEADLTILSPRNYQVFQRSSLKEGTIVVSGRTRMDVDEVLLRVTGKSQFGTLDEAWQRLPVIIETGQFNLRMSLPAGGWYHLEAQAKRQGQTVAEARVDRFGVGEVLVGAGQSNSTNCGEFRTQQNSGMVSSFSGTHWQLADDPQPGVADGSQGGSFWPALGDALYEKYRVPIGVATTGYGGTSVDQWQPDEDLFKWTMTRINQLGPLGFRALLWHQGESDVDMPSEEYYAKLKNVILASRLQAGWDFPWFVAQASYHNPEKTRHESVRSAQAKLWEDKTALPGPDTDTLVGDNRDLGGRGIHFSPKGLKAHGEMWAEKVIAFTDEALQRDGGKSLPNP